MKLVCMESISNSRIADPVYFQLDPDPENQNLKIGSGSATLNKRKEKLKYLFI